MKHSHPRAIEVLFCMFIAAAGGTVLTTSVSRAQDGTPEIDNIVVSAQPIRDSVERSLEVQREADNLVSVMAADAIGRFPDSTAAAALARLPLLTMFGVPRDTVIEDYALAEIEKCEGSVNQYFERVLGIFHGRPGINPSIVIGGCAV